MRPSTYPYYTTPRTGPRPAGSACTGSMTATIRSARSRTLTSPRTRPAFSAQPGSPRQSSVILSEPPRTRPRITAFEDRNRRYWRKRRSLATARSRPSVHHPAERQERSRRSHDPLWRCRHPGPDRLDRHLTHLTFRDRWTGTGLLAVASNTVRRPGIVVLSLGCHW